VWELDWRGGSTAAAIVSDDPTESAWYGARVALLDLSARSATTVHRPEWQVAAPRLAPDGAAVCFVEGFCSDRGVLAGTVTVAGGSPEARRLPLETDVSWLEWRDAESLWYAGWHGMGTSCGSLSLDGSANELFSGPETVGVRYQPRIAVSADGRVIAAVRESSDEPPEVAVLEDGAWRTISALNADVVAEIVRPDWEEVSWTARDGLEIEGLLARPPERTGEALPLVVVVHGGPTGAWSHQFAPYAGTTLLLAEAGYAVLLPNPRGSIGRGQDFARANLGDMGGEDLQDILAGIDSLVEAEIADGERLAITGGSYGGFMAAWAATQTDRFAASIPMACVSHWLSFHLTTNIGRFDELFLDADPFDPVGEYAARSPVFHARKCRTPTLVMHGEIDLCTPLGQAQELYQALVEAGVEAELVVYPREGHGWVEWDHQIDTWNRVRSWLDRHLARDD
jgi:dipeptidyl aminopeptidase/acylaminoacyl peptidase